MLTGRTHFEQVPLEIVRRITEKQSEELNANHGVGGDDASAAETATTEDANGQTLQYPAWQKPCQEALVELDPEKLKERIIRAEAAVFQRLQELVHSPDGQTERQALIDVTSSLRFLKRDVLKYPEGEFSATI